MREKKKERKWKNEAAEKKNKVYSKTDRCSLIRAPWDFLKK
jgi:hypothetical protein